MRPLRIAIIGFGKIAQDQHVPSIALHDRLELAATVSRSGTGIEGLAGFRDHREMLREMPDLDAVAICTPPSVRYDIARDCLEAGLHCLLEKPPAVTLGEIEDLACIAEGRQLTLFTTWHAQANPAVTAAAALLASQRIAAMEIVWREDVRKWHPGQQWIWEPGGFGVFDPGINALSIATHILPGPIVLDDAELEFPANREAPIAARLSLRTAAGAPIAMDLDWRQTGPQTWDIQVETDAGPLLLSQGGAVLTLPSGTSRAEDREYPALYARFAELIQSRSSEVDTDPLRLVTDAFLRGKAIPIEPFYD